MKFRAGRLLEDFMLGEARTMVGFFRIILPNWILLKTDFFYSDIYNYYVDLLPSNVLSLYKTSAYSPAFSTNKLLYLYAILFDYKSWIATAEPFIAFI